jgi:hypothetical protein
MFREIGGNIEWVLDAWHPVGAKFETGNGIVPWDMLFRDFWASCDNGQTWQKCGTEVTA